MSLAGGHGVKEQPHFCTETLGQSCQGQAHGPGHSSLACSQSSLFLLKGWECRDVRFATKTSHFTKIGGGERTTERRAGTPQPHGCRVSGGLAGFFLLIKTTRVLPVTPRRSQDAHGGGRQKTLQWQHRERLRDAAVTAGSSVFAARGRVLGARSGAAGPLGSKFSQQLSRRRE